MTDALAIRNLTVAYRSGGRDRTVLRDVSFRIGRGETYGLVGESGCGKSTVALTAGCASTAFISEPKTSVPSRRA